MNFLSGFFLKLLFPLSLTFVGYLYGYAKSEKHQLAKQLIIERKYNETIQSLQETQYDNAFRNHQQLKGEIERVKAVVTRKPRDVKEDMRNCIIANDIDRLRDTYRKVFLPELSTRRRVNEQE